MVDREKVIKGLECCASTACRDCPYSSDCVVDEFTGTTYLAADAIELLEEQKHQIEYLEYSLGITESNLRHYINGND